MSSNLKLQNWPIRLIVDIILLIILIIVNENFKSIWRPTTQRGFFCNDESLMYPYHEDTVSSALSHFIGTYGPLIFIIILEIYLISWQLAKIQWHKYINLYSTVRWFLYGYIFTDIIKEIGKQTIGRLRPHFFAVCQPLLEDGGTCSDLAHSTERGVYHLNYTCQPKISGATKKMLIDLHVSFPSGHSSKVFFGLVFLALHLQRRRWPLCGSLLSGTLQLLCYSLAWFVGLSRVMDNKHHWSDVAAGSLLGASVAFVVIQAAKLEEEWQTKRFKLNGKENEKEPTSTSTSTPPTPPSPPLAAPPTAPAAVAVRAGSEIVINVGEKTEQLSHDLKQATCFSAN